MAKLIIISDDALERLKGLLRASEYFEPAVRARTRGSIHGAQSPDDILDQDIQNSIKLAITVPGSDPTTFRERLTREVNLAHAAGSVQKAVKPDGD
jgi:hypothetical protein